ncbi:MAG TPA: regulatory iron-sulfur-containing complex subunit RicT [Bacteroidales bacterium]|nr:regulatory iron-sulfur-containing complex subunit RicT [Bacteroidales bacterium]HPR57005.1 regulatory iron-sulfur-containing complex subunit RicT [Bacteroidales bacterium]HRW96677.1 regulatory iron-sulfur-containing complex subunit RicT [Bacteroidales bacterium]
MENNDLHHNSPTDQNFLSRGCCHAPQLYHDNKDIANDRCCKLNTFDWMKDLPLPDYQLPFDCIEVRFKNSRKDFFRVQDDTKFATGDIVAVEASPGHDIGIVSLTGEIVKLQMRKKNVDPASAQIKKVYRRARLSDIEKWINAVDLEPEVTLKSRKIARDMNLDMKIHDVEYQGDETKAVFYYTAQERVDFRQLIKVLAEEFKVRVEMRQIGARQEAARLGGIGSCGRELCCATWLSSFSSVSTNKARIQQMTSNPQKLAGQCGKLKCCLNYEYDVYTDALKEFPDMNIRLHTEKGDAIHQKSDVFKRTMWYSYVNDQSNLLPLSVDTVNQIISDNKKGLIPKSLEDLAVQTDVNTNDVGSALQEEDIHRFDKKEDKSKRRPKRKFSPNKQKGQSTNIRNKEKTGGSKPSPAAE